MNVPFLDLGASYREIQEEVEEAVLRSLRSGWYIGGEDVESFEHDFAAFTEARFCVGVANGLEALHLALRALGIGPGDEVIVPSNTFIATWLAVSQCGAVPVPVEPNTETFNLNIAQIESAITSRTKAIIPVHLYGQPADIDGVLEVARQYGLRVLEDAAQAQGARYKGRAVGGHGDVVAWSFYPGKNLGALGDAGAITTNDEVLADRVRVLRNYGSRKRYINEVRGFNSRLDPVQAAVLRVKLRHLPEWNVRRSTIAERYSSELAGIGLILPRVEPFAKPAWHLYCVRHPLRDTLRTHLSNAGVETLIHYPVPPHLQGAYSELGFPVGAFPVAESMADSLISLPIGPALSREQVNYVISAIKDSLSPFHKESQAVAGLG
ncbi:MAG: DegT/DnrJ/EryC1/StrS family aminotransferase [Candidatus Accumulibacter phosphatis]|jgi:dTDP-4-amino-4,6-dideoxygalactose transaminase|uniref:DegT/DnrJ/EryC1/StrS family aminotransferase n=1 Tax=Candidatus Accumulibacter sp. ACC012 TaxID=2823332 RepID=UPI0025B8E84D|nr:DegT/DnrJ/EryC1/StrS family aminotransferase [Candidatus Accumulibacter sp. ACC012]